jgi:hypothetical protein
VVVMDMPTDVNLGRVRSVLDDLDYPITRVDAATALEEVRLLHAGGEANLGALVSETGSDAFESPDDIETELHSVLPREAVGEPGQSEGEG